LLRYLKKIFYNSVAELRIKILPQLKFMRRLSIRKKKKL
jgi:hypothetical protein